MDDETLSGRERFVAFGRRLMARVRVTFLALVGLTDRGGWVAPGVLGCAYPRTERALTALSANSVRLLVNLHERPHNPVHLARFGLEEVHLPVKDFTAPSLIQIERGVNAVFEARARGDAVAVHCGGGLGRTGTMLACYLASCEGLCAQEAIEYVRSIRPGSVETHAQAAAVDAWTRRQRPTSH